MLDCAGIEIFTKIAGAAFYFLSKNVSITNIQFLLKVLPTGKGFLLYWLSGSFVGR
jgi:hypothetical protein